MSDTALPRTKRNPEERVTRAQILTGVGMMLALFAGYGLGRVPSTGLIDGLVIVGGFFILLGSIVAVVLGPRMFKVKP